MDIYGMYNPIARHPCSEAPKMASAAGHSEAFSQLLMAALKITTLGDSPRSAACRKKKTQRLGEIKRDLYVVLYIYIYKNYQKVVLYI